MSFDITSHVHGAARAADLAEPSAPAEPNKPARKKAARPTTAKGDDAVATAKAARELLEAIADGEVAISLLRLSEWQLLLAAGVVRRRRCRDVAAAAAAAGAERDARRELSGLPSLEEATRTVDEARQVEAAVAAELQGLDLVELDVTAIQGVAVAMKAKMEAASEARRVARRVVDRIRSLRHLLAGLAPEAIATEVRRRLMDAQKQGSRGRLLHLQNRRDFIGVAIDASNPLSPLHNTDHKFANSCLDGFIENMRWSDLISRQPFQTPVLRSKEFRDRVMKLAEELPAIEAEIVELETVVVELEDHVQQPLEAWIDSGVVPKEYF